MVSKTKICSRCGKGKPLDAFYKQKGGGNGRRGMCKVCFRGAERAAYARDPEVQKRQRQILEKWREEGVDRWLDRCADGCI
jgi:hypothetical protein